MLAFCGVLRDAPQGASLSMKGDVPMMDFILSSERNIVAFFLFADLMFAILLSYVLCRIVYAIQAEVLKYIRSRKRVNRRRRKGAKVYGYTRHDKNIAA